MNEKMKKEEDLDEDESVVVVVLWFRLSDVRESASVSRVRTARRPSLRLSSFCLIFL